MLIPSRGLIRILSQLTYWSHRPTVSRRSGLILIACARSGIHELWLSIGGSRRPQRQASRTLHLYAQRPPGRRRENLSNCHVLARFDSRQPGRCRLPRQLSVGVRQPASETSTDACFTTISQIRRLRSSPARTASQAEAEPAATFGGFHDWPGKLPGDFQIRQDFLEFLTSLVRDQRIVKAKMLEFD